MLHLLYPPACLLCHQPIASAHLTVCEACNRSLARYTPPVCQRCGRPLSAAYDADVLCAHCRRRPTAFEQARAPWVYRGAARQAILAFKYHGHHRLGAWLAYEMAELAKDILPMDEIDLVVPVPRHWLKRRLRGIDPAVCLARRLAHSLHRPIDQATLRRVRWTASQTRLSPAQRTRNVRHAFRARADRLQDRTVLLIDDVLTSGATAQACAQTLRESGARRVFVLTGACALPAS